ncbi:MAG: glycosyltransferase [Actinobacteria bacterium]|nr:glycosyltransferase [Actinomycetota bacterium]
MKIVHAIARLNVGGAALSLLELAAEQRARGHDVLVIAGRIPSGEASMEYLSAELGVPHLHLQSLQREVSFGSDLAASYALRGLLRQRRPDVLHTHTAKAGATGRLAALSAGRNVPRAVVHTFHGHVLSGYFSARREFGFRLVERALAYATDAIIAVSDEVRDDLVRLRVAPASKIEVVPYGFDLATRLDVTPETRALRRASLGAAEDDFVIGWAGRLTEIKRPLDLIRTLARVDRALLVLAGDGELRRAVESLAEELEVADRVRFLGYVDDMGSLYAAFDSFLLTSGNEGTPVVAIESLGAGVPVVATDAGGTRTVVDDGKTGFVVPIGDVRALSEALAQLRDHPELRTRFGDLGRETMLGRFGVARMVDEIERVYARALEA